MCNNTRYYMYNYSIIPCRNIVLIPSSCIHLYNFNYTNLFRDNLVRSNTLFKYHTLIEVYIINIITYIRVQ